MEAKATIEADMARFVDWYRHCHTMTSIGPPDLMPLGSVPRLLFVDNQVNDVRRGRMILARELRDAGFDVHIAVPRENGLDDISSNGIPVHTYYLHRTSTRPLDELRCCISLLRLYRQLQPTLVHHFGLKPTLYGGISSRIAGVPAVVSTLAGLGYLFTTQRIKARTLGYLVTLGLRFCFGHQNHAVIFQNPDDRKRLIEGGIVPRDRAVLIKGSGVNLSLFTPKPELAGPPVVLMASRLLWNKGVAEFVAAAQALRHGGIHCRFLLAGQPDRGHPCAVPVSMLRRWRDNGDVEWLGWRDDMPALIAQSHIVCLPSYYGEGIPRILLEAAASGRAMVATDSPGCREVVRHGQNGLLVPVGDAQALAKAIAQLIDDRLLRLAMGNRGREIAAIEFSVEQVITANFILYRSLLDSVLKARNLIQPQP